MYLVIINKNGIKVHYVAVTATRVHEVIKKHLKDLEPNLKKEIVGAPQFRNYLNTLNLDESIYKTYGETRVSITEVTKV